MSASLIEYYLNQQATKEIRDRGLALFFDKKVGELKFNDNLKIVEAEVQGKGDTYTVIVSEYRNMNIKAECNCPYNFGGICKHSVAVCNKILSTVFSKPQLPKKAIKPSKVARRTSSPIEIVDFEDFSSAVLDKYYTERNNYFKFFKYQIKKINLIESGLIFTIKDLINYQGYEYIVKAFKEDGRYFTLCSCDKTVVGVCKHQFDALEHIIKKGKRVLQYFDSDFIPSTLLNTVRQQNIPEKYATTDNISVEVNNSLELEVSFKGELNGILFNQTEKEKFQNYLNLRVKLNKSVLERSFVEKQTSNYARGYVLQFDYYSAGVSEQLVPVEGELTKDNTRFKSSIRIIGFSDLLDSNSSEKDRELLVLSEQLKSLKLENRKLHGSDEYNMPVIRKAHQALLKAFRLLEGSELTFYLKNNEIYIKKHTIEPVKISAETVGLEVALRSDDDFIWLSPQICIGDDKFDLSETTRISDFVWLRKHTFYPLGLFSLFPAIEIFYTNSNIRMFKSNSAEFVKNIVIPLSQRFNIEIEGLDNYDISEVYLKPQKKQVYLSEMEGQILFTPVVVYNHAKEVEAMSQGNIIEENEGQIKIYNRNEDYEAGLVEFVRSLHEDFSNQFNESSLTIALNAMLENNWFFDAFKAMQEKEIEVLGLQQLASFKYSPYRPAINTGITSGEDWFDVSLEVSFGDEVITLKKLKKFIINKEKFIRLGDGSIGILPEEWIAKLDQYFRVGEIKDDKILVSKMRFSIVDELFDQIDDEAVLSELADKKKRLESFSEISKTKKPAAIKATLRDYQKEGVNWLLFLNEMRWGGILADDMGLGKTVQILTLVANIQKQKPKTSLVVVPTTLIFNWENEVKKFFPSLNVFFYYGSNREKDHQQFENYSLVVTTYGLMLNDIEILSKIKFNYIILDESQAIKNPLSKRFKAACLLQSKHRLTLTGTPIENNTFDLFAQMTFVNPGFLGTQKYFKEYYSTPIDKDQDPARAGELRKLINPFILRRTKEQVATELPPKTEDVIFCQMEKSQWRVYEEYRNKYRDYLMKKIDEKGMNNAKMFVLEGLIKLRQICNSPKLIEAEKEINHESVKLDELMRQITEKTGKHKIVVFSQFVKMLKLIEEELKRDQHNYEYFDGSSTQKQRRESVNRFQNDAGCRVFLISLKAGGTGINLTAADYVYIVDPWWNPAVENQAIDRTYRIGQDKKVFAYRMICKDTVEEKIMRYQDRKRQVAADIIRTEDSFVKQLTKEDISDLFS